LRALLLAALLALSVVARAAVDDATLRKLSTGDGDEKAAVIAAIVASGDERASVLLKTIAEGEVTVGGEKLEVIVNNRLRGEIEAGLASLALLSPDVEARRAAVKSLASSAGETTAVLVKKALARETDPGIKASLALIAASIDLQSPDKATRIAAIRALASSPNPTPPPRPPRRPSEPTRTLESAIASERSRRASGVRSSRATSGREPWRSCSSPRARHHVRAHGRHQHGSELIMIGTYDVVGTSSARTRPAPSTPTRGGRADVLRGGAGGDGAGARRHPRLYGRPLETLLPRGASASSSRRCAPSSGRRTCRSRTVFMSRGIEMLAGCYPGPRRDHRLLRRRGAGRRGAAACTRLGFVPGSRRTARWRPAWACAPRA
jgi:urea transport system permease protein